ncbi:hypothetical protein [Serratia sp. Se-RSBMAAmG]|uniref:hypothetical protein n=1 Tax=Serratia sp. Se-RSBMAAmG TaxID=3043305 RepID=UPI0024AF0839|nr:hypothetical protein [Serratia sp. Se-RSBMAAmG]MDI6976002.1 hypothetical protein [Serratia sp. Se-RSBMAAmG]
MILNKNIHGTVLTKTVINNEIQYKIESGKYLYTVYCPDEAEFDLPVNSEIFASYKRDKLLWGKKKAFMVSDDPGEAWIRSTKKDIKYFFFDTFLIVGSFFFFHQSLPLNDNIKNVHQLFVQYNLLLLFFVSIVLTIGLFSKSANDFTKFVDIYRKRERKNGTHKKYRKYVKDNFNFSAKFLNKKLKEEDKQKLISFVNNEQDYSEGETILIEDIIDKEIIKIQDIPTIDVKKITKLAELKYPK